MSGYPDNSFKPNVQIRADEFIKILVSSIDENVKSYKNGYWSDSYIQSAKELGIILFNNEMPMVEQFDIQINEYLEEVKWIDNINKMK